MLPESMTHDSPHGEEAGVYFQRFDAENLPPGLVCHPTTGVIGGMTKETDPYDIRVRCQGSLWEREAVIPFSIHTSDNIVVHEESIEIKDRRVSIKACPHCSHVVFRQPKIKH